MYTTLRKQGLRKNISFYAFNHHRTILAQYTIPPITFPSQYNRLSVIISHPISIVSSIHILVSFYSNTNEQISVT